MEELCNSILYGTLGVDIPEKLSLAQHLEVIRALLVNPSAYSRIKIPLDFHPWARMLYSKFAVELEPEQPPVQ